MINQYENDFSATQKVLSILLLLLIIIALVASFFYFKKRINTMKVFIFLILGGSMLFWGMRARAVEFDTGEFKYVWGDHGEFSYFRAAGHVSLDRFDPTIGKSVYKPNESITGTMDATIAYCDNGGPFFLEYTALNSYGFRNATTPKNVDAGKGDAFSLQAPPNPGEYYITFWYLLINKLNPNGSTNPFSIDPCSGIPRGDCIGYYTSPGANKGHNFSEVINYVVTGCGNAVTTSGERCNAPTTDFCNISSYQNDIKYTVDTNGQGKWEWTCKSGNFKETCSVLKTVRNWTPTDGSNYCNGETFTQNDSNCGDSRPSSEVGISGSKDCNGACSTSILGNYCPDATGNPQGVTLNSATLCDRGDLSNFSGTADPSKWTWDCIVRDLDNHTGTPANNCQIMKNVAFGKCKTYSQSLDTAPTDGCLAGTQTAATKINGAWRWTCQSACGMPDTSCSASISTNWQEVP